MSGLLKADFFRVMKSKLTLVLLILVAAFPVLITLMYLVMAWMMGEGSIAEMMGYFSANTMISGAYSLTNNIGLVIPAFAGILICSDFSNGTLRNKVVTGSRRWEIYLSHLIVSVVFSVVMITLYTLITAGLSLLFFKFSAEGIDMAEEVLYWSVTGTMGFVYMATVATFFAMVTRSTAPTIIFTLVLAILLLAVSTAVSLMDYTNFRHLVYMIPTFTYGSFTLNSVSLTDITSMIGGVVEENRQLLFIEGVLSYVFFGALHTALGIILFSRKDIK